MPSHISMYVTSLLLLSPLEQKKNDFTWDIALYHMHRLTGIAHLTPRAVNIFCNININWIHI